MEWIFFWRKMDTVHLSTCLIDCSFPQSEWKLDYSYNNYCEALWLRLHCSVLVLLRFITILHRYSNTDNPIYDQYYIDVISINFDNFLILELAICDFWFPEFSNHREFGNYRSLFISNEYKIQRSNKNFLLTNS